MCYYGYNPAGLPVGTSRANGTNNQGNHYLFSLGTLGFTRNASEYVDQATNAGRRIISWHEATRAILIHTFQLLGAPPRSSGTPAIFRRRGDLPISCRSVSRFTKSMFG